MIMLRVLVRQGAQQNPMLSCMIEILWPGVQISQGAMTWPGQGYNKYI